LTKHLGHTPDNFATDPTMRKWATERREFPLKDVAAAGGWKDVTTLLTCYQHADEATMLKVMESPVRLVSRRAAGVP
jgi:hypothetical protein